MMFKKGFRKPSLNLPFLALFRKDCNKKGEKLKTSNDRLFAVCKENDYNEFREQILERVQIHQS